MLIQQWLGCLMTDSNLLAGNQAIMPPYIVLVVSFTICLSPCPFKILCTRTAEDLRAINFAILSRQALGAKNEPCFFTEELAYLQISYIYLLGIALVYLLTHTLEHLSTFNTTWATSPPLFIRLLRAKPSQSKSLSIYSNLACPCLFSDFEAWLCLHVLYIYIYIYIEVCQSREEIDLSCTICDLYFASGGSKSYKPRSGGLPSKRASWSSCWHRRQLQRRWCICPLG